MIDNIVELSKDQLLAETQNAKYDNYRFVTATCVDTSDGSMDVIYHFDKDLVLKNFRVKVGKGDEVPSISKIYLCAVLVENEMKELFGLNVTNMAIDYGGHMLLSDDDLNSPMSKQQITIEKRGTK
jgi:ech hydrogenase subunit D